MIRNNINNKLYVGISSNPKRRWYDHRKRAKKISKESFAIHFAMNKYGLDNFEMKIVETLSNYDEANKKEMEWIALLKDLKYQLYNETEGGRGHLGKIGPVDLTPEERKRRSESILGEKNFFYGKKLFGSANGHFGHKMKPHVKKTLLKYRAKITPIQVEEIKKLHQEGETQTALAKQFGLSLTQIHRIIKGIRWTKGQSSTHTIRPQLTKNQVEEIRQLYQTGNFTYKTLSEKFNISAIHCYRIITRRKWNNIT